MAVKFGLKAIWINIHAVYTSWCCCAISGDWLSSTAEEATANQRVAGGRRTATLSAAFAVS